MARHLMAVCVVCILCAEQFPCKEHFNNLTQISKQQLNKISSSSLSITAAKPINNKNSYENEESLLLNLNSNNKDDILLKDNHKENYQINNNNDDNDDDNEYRIDIQNYNNKRKGRTKKEIMANSTKFIEQQQHKHNQPNDHYHDRDYHRHHMITTSTTAAAATATATTQKFLKKLFEQFGNSDGQTMDLNGFETMLKRLGLYNLIKDNIPNDNNNNNNNNNNNRINYNNNKNYNNNNNNNNKNNNEESTSDESCISSLELISRLSSSKIEQPEQQQHHHHHEIEPIKLDQNNNNNNAKANINTTGSNEESKNNSNGIINENHHEHNSDNDHDPNYQKKRNIQLNFDNIFSICPILLYQLTAPTSLERSGCINSSLIPLQNNNNNNMLLSSSPLVAASTDYDEDFQEDRFYVWIYATVSVLGVSLVGLLGVAVIPCMDRHIYQHIIQFLVALAVGTLAGDALLHLLPHSMMTFSSHESGHESMVWKGLVAVLGIIFFFAMERGLTMIAEWRKKIEKKEKPSSRVRVMRDPDSTSINNSIAGDKLCKHKYSSYPYCYDEIAMDTKDDHHHHHQDMTNQKNNSTTATIEGGVGVKTEKTSATPITCNKNSIHAYRNNSNNDHGDNNETAQSLLPPHNYTTISDSFSVMNNKDDGNNPDNNTISTNLDDNSIEGGVRDKPLMREETFTIILREHESSHHGHSHKHGHVHSPPRTLSAVAWMVVMGDGLHNFTDGMAIGAAFSNNIAGGFSTAIAVFCHELPHELGDFAVLLKAGMSAKQAVYYNLLSSVLSFFGMILGVLIGDTPEASAWIFACAAGMFIYIALVDMMPELTSTHNERCALSQCLLQLLGMSSGLGIMLLIALYEHDLKQIFSTSSGGHHHHNHFH